MPTVPHVCNHLAIHLYHHHWTEWAADWHMVEEDFVKTQQKVHTLWEELTALSSVNTGVTSPQGNAGLFRSAGYLFDPISDFYTVIQALLVVGGNLYNDYTTGGYAPYMNNNDIVRSPQNLLHGSTIH